MTHNAFSAGATATRRRIPHCELQGQERTGGLRNGLFCLIVCSVTQSLWVTGTASRGQRSHCRRRQTVRIIRLEGADTKRFGKTDAWSAGVLTVRTGTSMHPIKIPGTYLWVGQYPFCGGVKAGDCVGCHISRLRWRSLKLLLQNPLWRSWQIEHHAGQLDSTEAGRSSTRHAPTAWTFRQ